MKLLVLFAVFASAYGYGNPYSKMNPKDFEDKVWKLITQINDENPEAGNYIIPITITSARFHREKKFYDLKVYCGDSLCPKYSVNSKRPVDSTSCQLDPNGQRYDYEIMMFENPTTTVRLRKTFPKGFNTTTREPEHIV